MASCSASISVYVGEILSQMEQELGLCLPQVPAVPCGAALCSHGVPAAVPQPPLVHCARRGLSSAPFHIQAVSELVGMRAC